MDRMIEGVKERGYIKNQMPRTQNPLDAELEALLSKQKAKIKVVGCGGGGNNTINRISEVGITGIETIAINTDAQDLLYTNADTKILIGKTTTQGLGAGSVPQVGEEAARENEHEIKEKLQGSDMIFITCGLGGGTGSGSAPVVAEVAKKLGALTVAIVTMPFEMEGQRRFENATFGLEKLDCIVDTLIVIPNDKLLDLAPDLPLHTEFKVADEILTNSVKGIAELVTKTGLVNLDFADIRTVMGKGGVAVIGVGESDTQSRVEEAVKQALTHPLLDVDYKGATGALIHITCGPDFKLEEFAGVGGLVTENISADAQVIIGARVNKEFQNKVRVITIMTGVKSPYVTGKRAVREEAAIKSEMSDLGIEVYR